MMLVAARLPSEGGLVAVLFGMAVAEAGFVTANVPLTIAATGGVGKSERGLASGVLSTSTEIGNALGWAAVAAPWSPRSRTADQEALAPSSAGSVGDSGLRSPSPG